MKINLSPDELLEFAQSGKISPEMRTHLTGAILSILMSDEAVEVAMKTVKDTAMLAASGILHEALRVEKDWNGNQALKGYMGQELQRKISAELNGQTIFSIVQEEIKKRSDDSLAQIIQAAADKSVHTYVTAIVKESLSNLLTNRLTDEYIEESMSRILKKKLG